MKIFLIMPHRVKPIPDTHKIIAEGIDGYFCILPRHIDFVSALVPGILIYTVGEDEDKYIALDSGVLVKQGHLVRISTFNATMGQELDELREVVETEFKQMDERERQTRSLLYKMETETLKSFAELGREK
jgi:F-type H+-transporting ATPase subunit epsilon